MDAKIITALWKMLDEFGCSSPKSVHRPSALSPWIIISAIEAAGGNVLMPGSALRIKALELAVEYYATDPLDDARKFYDFLVGKPIDAPEAAV